MKILSSITHPQVVANLYEFLSFAEHTGRYFEERLEPNSIDFHSISFFYKEVNGAKQPFSSNRSSKHLPLCSAEERNSYRFATT